MISNLRTEKLRLFSFQNTAYSEIMLTVEADVHWPVVYIQNEEEKTVSYIECRTVQQFGSSIIIKFVHYQ